MSTGNYEHPAARRVNIPTSENQGLVPDDDKAVKTLLYPRNPDLDPQLVWRGKDAEDSDDLQVAAPPIYIQEKIHPKAIVADLKRRSQARRPAVVVPQIDLFDDFNGLPDEEARTEFYAHDQNWSNRMILGDSLQVMGSLAERETLRGKVQMVYLDPPYGIKFNSNWQPSTKTRDVRDGKVESVSREPEVVRAFRDTWVNGVHSYLSYLRDRLTVARDLLHESGSVFVQIGDENVHLVRVLLDEIFGTQNFCALITFRKKMMPLGSDVAEGVSDYILWYARSRAAVKGRPLFREKKAEGEASWSFAISPYGTHRRLTKDEAQTHSLISDESRVYQAISLLPAQYRPNQDFTVEFEGVIYPPPKKNSWSTHRAGMHRLMLAGRLHPSGATLRYVLCHADYPIARLTNLWADTGGADALTYVVQTHTEVVKRCMLMSTDPGDLVLDPTCGSGTTAYVAEQWGRRWITIDTSRVALALARTRLMAARYDWYLPRDSAEGSAKETELTGKASPVPPAGHRPDLRQGFVFERAPHVTLGSIANNAEIEVIWERWQGTLEPLRERINSELCEKWQDWDIPQDAGADWPANAKANHAAWWGSRRKRQEEIDASIARNGEVELLYDRPYKARGVVRVSGPFTVESLSPHRVLPLGEDPFVMEALAEGRVEPAVEAEIKAEAEQTDFAQVVYENLKAAGVQNTKKGETIRFEWLRPFPSKRGYVAFEGLYLENGEERRAAVAIGPEYDTVGYDLVRNAAREAMDAFDTLIVCGFAFAPEVDESRLNFGRLTVLKARMNQDLRMGDRLKATGAGNLFVVFGEPDIGVEDAGDGLIRIRLNGVDIFDPTTGEVRSSKDVSEDIACWFIDDDYDQESFFVRQAYFLGRDPYESLKRALKAEVDETAWAELNSPVSRPFPRPESGNVCVKVINHFGDEVQKVFSV